MLNLLALALPGICLLVTTYVAVEPAVCSASAIHYDLLGSVATPPYVIGVDFSTVTTLVPLLTSYLTLAGVVRCVKAGPTKAGLWRPHFPYSRPIKTLLVQLGLIGTIAGFIVAFRDLGQPCSMSTWLQRTRHVNSIRCLIRMRLLKLVESSSYKIDYTSKSLKIRARGRFGSIPKW